MMHLPILDSMLAVLVLVLDFGGLSKGGDLRRDLKGTRGIEPGLSPQERGPFQLPQWRSR